MRFDAAWSRSGINRVLDDRVRIDVPGANQRHCRDCEIEPEWVEDERLNADDPPVRYHWPARIALDRRGSVENETCGPDDGCEAAREGERKCA